MHFVAGAEQGLASATRDGMVEAVGVGMSEHDDDLHDCTTLSVRTDR
jgi:hypothetical protein